MEFKGPVLVTGGTGFMGYHIIRALLKEMPSSSIVSINRNPKDNFCEGVDYRTGSITDASFVTTLINEVKPQVIIHTASPRPVDPNLKEAVYKDTNVQGTKILLECAAKSPDVKAFVHTSTVNVQAGGPHHNIDESGPLWTANAKCIPYWRSKAEAEKLVLQANGSDLATVTMRLPLIIGERDYAMVPNYLDAYDKKQTGVQLGDGKNKIDTVAAESAAEAHMIAAKALLNPSLADGKVDGEAFHITDGNPVPFWSICRIIWNEAGDTTQEKDVKIIPAWAANAMASVAETSYAIFTLGTKSPALTKHIVNFCLYDYTYSNEKARKVLKFNPVARTEEVIRESTRWELQKRSGAATKPTEATK